MDGGHQAVLYGVQLFAIYRDVGIQILGFPQPVMDVVEILSPGVEPEFHQKGRADDRDVVVELPVQVLDAARRQLIPVHVHHEGEHLQHIVVDHARDRHFIDMGRCAVAEHEHARNLGEFLAVLQREVLAGNLHDAVDGRLHQIHQRIDVRGGGQGTVQVSAEAGEHGHDAVHGREEGNHFFGRNVHQVEVEAGFDVVLGTGGVEAFEVDVSHVGSGHGIGDLEGALPHGHIGRRPADEETVIFDAAGFQREIHIQVGRKYEKAAHGAVRRKLRLVHGLLHRLVAGIRKSLGGRVGGIIRIAPHEFVGVDVVALDIGLEPQAAAPPADERPPDSGELRLRRHVRFAGLQGDALQCQGVAPEGAFHGLNLCAERE